MKTKLILLLSIIVTIGCTSKKNDDNFIQNATGRYFFNADEIIEVYFKDKELFLKWRNSDLKPLKINDSTFYASELNEKLIFNTNNSHIALAKKREHKNEKFIFSKLKNGEKTPSEYLDENNFEKALAGYKTIRENDSLSRVIKERSLNKKGYAYIRSGELDKAITTFKINTELYPNSSNTFDSLGDAYLKKQDTLEAINQYKKALHINPENRSAKKSLKKISKNDN